MITENEKKIQKQILELNQKLEKSKLLVAELQSENKDLKSEIEELKNTKSKSKKLNLDIAKELPQDGTRPL